MPSSRYGDGRTPTRRSERLRTRSRRLPPGEQSGMKTGTRRQQLEALWDKEVDRSAAVLAKAWAPSVPPLPDLWPGYQLTRARTIRRIERRLITSVRSGESHQEGTGVEVDLDDPESGLFGRIDRVERRGPVTRVIDLKTGLRQGEPTQDQRRQLLLYALLVQRRDGEWPGEIVIEDASGSQTTMPLDPVAAEKALLEVSSAVRAFNLRVTRNEIVESAAPPPSVVGGVHFEWYVLRLACASIGLGAPLGFR